MNIHRAIRSFILRLFEKSLQEHHSCSHVLYIPSLIDYFFFSCLWAFLYWPALLSVDIARGRRFVNWSQTSFIPFSIALLRHMDLFTLHSGSTYALPDWVQLCSTRFSLRQTSISVASQLKRKERQEAYSVLSETDVGSICKATQWQGVKKFSANQCRKGLEVRGFARTCCWFFIDSVFSTTANS